MVAIPVVEPAIWSPPRTSSLSQQRRTLLLECDSELEVAGIGRLGNLVVDGRLDVVASAAVRCALELLAALRSQVGLLAR